MSAPSSGGMTRRLLWFAALWIGGVVALAVVAFTLRGIFGIA